MMTATAMRVMMTIRAMNDGAGDSDDFGGCPAFPSPRHSRGAKRNACARSETHTGRAQKKLFPGKRSPSPRRCPTRQRQRPISDSHCQEALHSLHARLVQAPSCAEMCAQGVHLDPRMARLFSSHPQCRALERTRERSFQKCDTYRKDRAAATAFQARQGHPRTSAEKIVHLDPADWIR